MNALFKKKIKSVIRTIFPNMLEDADIFWKFTEIVH